MSDEWQKRMFCNCGWSTKPSFGDPWFAVQSTPICPDCGTHFYTSPYVSDKGYTMKIVRWVEGEVIKVSEWWKFNKREPGYWEERKKDDTR